VSVPAFKTIPVNRRRKNPTQPGSSHANVTPSDTATFDPPFRRLHVGTGGTVTVIALDGSSAQYTAATGSYLEIAGMQVKSTGTAASNIVAIFADW